MKRGDRPQPQFRDGLRRLVWTLHFVHTNHIIPCSSSRMPVRCRYEPPCLLLVLRHVHSSLNGIVMIPQPRVICPYGRLLHPGRVVNPLQTRPGLLQISFTSHRHNATNVNPTPKRPLPAPRTKPISMLQTTLIGVSALTLAGLAYAW